MSVQAGKALIFILLTFSGAHAQVLTRHALPEAVCFRSREARDLSFPLAPCGSLRKFTWYMCKAMMLRVRRHTRSDFVRDISSWRCTKYTFSDLFVRLSPVYLSLLPLLQCQFHIIQRRHSNTPGRQSIDLTLHDICIHPITQNHTILLQQRR